MKQIFYQIKTKVVLKISKMRTKRQFNKNMIARNKFKA